MNPELITKKAVSDDRTDTVFTASYKDKTIIAPEDGTTIGVKGDHKSRRLIFKLLELPDEYNLLSAPRASMEIHYENADRETGRSLIRAEDGLEEVVQEDGTKCLVVPWLIPRTLTKRAGDVRVQLCCTAKYDSEETRHWHLSPITLKIGEAFDVEDTAYDVTEGTIVEDLIDALATNEQKLKDLESAFTSLPSGASPSQEITALKTRMTKVENEKLSATSAGQQYAKRSDFSALSADIAQVQSDVRSAENSAMDAKIIAQGNYTQINNVDARVAQIEDTLAHGGGSDSGLTTRIENLEQWKTNADTTLGGIQNDLESHGSRIASLEKSSGGGAASGCVVTITCAGQVNSEDSARVINAIRSGIMPVLYIKGTYHNVVMAKPSTSSCMNTVDLYYYDDTGSGAIWSHVTCYAEL